MLPNLSITKHDLNLECKQTWSGNKVHTYTRVNEGVGGIREAQTIIFCFELYIWSHSLVSKHVIYDIGTEILLLQ